MGRDRRAAAGEDAQGRVGAYVEPWRGLAAAQAGVVCRAQLLAAGCTAGQVGALLAARRWTGVHPGVYATFTGPLPPMSSAWAAVLAAGPGAALGGRSALWLWRALPEPPPSWTVCVPWERRVVAAESVVVCRRRDLDRLVHPAASPPRLRLDEALLDVIDATASPTDVIDVVLRVTSGRLTTPTRIRSAAEQRARLRHRRLLVQVLGDSADGVQSALEREYRIGVERAHGLPRAERNLQEPTLDADGRSLRSRYRDVRYRRWATVVELDGLGAHPEWLRHLDRRRDNTVTVAGERSLQYGWHEVVGEACRVAVEVIAVLRLAGWRGTPRACGAGCPVA